MAIRQVSEVYMLPDSVFTYIQQYLNCAESNIRKININVASMETLKAHPYLRWFHAKAIIKYRAQKGDWTSVDLLQILPEFDDGQSTFSNVKPYLSIK